jgi:hypothetical protein
MSNPLYNPCERIFPNATEFKLAGVVPCLNEGLYFCRLCSKRFCEDHLCEHLSAAYDAGEIARKPTIIQRASNDGTLFGMEDDTTEKGFSEYTEDQLKALPEMRLRMRQSRLFAELKRIQRELERRMIYDAEMQGIRRRSPIMPGSRYSVPSGSNFVKDVQRTAKQDAKQTKRQDAIQQALTMLADMLAKGQISKTQLNSQVKKAKVS